MGLLDDEERFAKLQATPRNQILGLLSDFIAKSYSPERTQQMQGVSKFMGAPAISETLDRLSYGQPLTTGAGGLGGTTRIRPEALEAAMAVAPMVGPAARTAGAGAMAAGRAGERFAERAVPRVMERGGLLADLLQDMSQGTQSMATSRSPNVGGVPVRELLYPNRAELTPAEKSAITSFEKSLSNQAVMRREEMRLAGGDIVTPTPGLNLIPEIQYNPKNLVGKRLVPVFGDLSPIGGDVYQVAGVPLTKPVTQQAGRKYSLVQPNVQQEIAYASEPGAAASKIANLNKYPDEDVLGVFFGGSPESVDFSHHMAQSFVRQLDALKPKKEAIKLFNNTIKNFPVEVAVAGSTKKVRTYPFKNFAGIDSPNIEELLTVKGAADYTPGQLRTAISKAVNTAKFRDLGFPIYGDTQKVMTEQGLRPGYAGQTLFESIPDRNIVLPDYLHQSYSAGIPGRYVGGLNIANQETGVPSSLLFPKLFAEQRARGARDDQILAKMRMSHQGEQFTEEGLQSLLDYLGR
jgi:hypothetical protein